MIDSGADRDVVSASVVNELSIPTKLVQMEVITVDNSIIENRRLASFSLQSLDLEYVVDVDDALVGDLLTSERDIPPCDRDYDDQFHIKGVKFPSASGSVRMIIGAAHSDAAVALECRRGPPGSLTCFRCMFGWTVSSKTGKKGLDVASINAITVDNRDLHEKIDRIFYHDFASIVSSEEMGESLENQRAVEAIKEKIYFDPVSGKYHAPVT